MKGRSGKLEKERLYQKDKPCRYHEGHKRYHKFGKNWHDKVRKIRDRERTREYIITRYGEKAWHYD